MAAKRPDYTHRPVECKRDLTAAPAIYSLTSTNQIRLKARASRTPHAAAGKAAADGRGNSTRPAARIPGTALRRRQRYCAGGGVTVCLLDSAVSEMLLPSWPTCEE